MDSALRASLRLSKIAPGDFVTAFNPGYLLQFGLSKRHCDSACYLPVISIFAASRIC
jgi:hypothetical protein